MFFILYSIDHLKNYKDSFLKKKSQKKIAYSGLIYLLFVGVVLISGVVLFFYDADYVAVWNPIHFYSSFFILITLFLTTGLLENNHLNSNEKIGIVYLLRQYIKNRKHKKNRKHSQKQD